MTVAELKKIWAPEAQGKVTKWSDVRAGWPDEEIKLYGAGTDSGTFDYFTEAIVGKAKCSRSDYTASEDDNVLVAGRRRRQVRAGLLRLRLLRREQGQAQGRRRSTTASGRRRAVAPTEETVTDGTYQPLSRPIFIYVERSRSHKPGRGQFVDFYLSRRPTWSRR